jgi:hypothetical protein
MLVQAQGGEAQAARGFWAVPGKKKSTIVAGSWRGVAQAAGGPIRGLVRAKSIVYDADSLDNNYAQSRMAKIATTSFVYFVLLTFVNKPTKY